MISDVFVGLPKIVMNPIHFHNLSYFWRFNTHFFRPGVYSRLWCVYEAYLGVQMHKTYLLPVKPRTSVVMKAVMWNMVPSFCGILSGIPLMVAFEWSDKTTLFSTGSLGAV